MISPYLWLQPQAAPAALSTVAQLLKGEVPSPADKLASALQQAESSECEGLLKDPELRKDFAAAVKAAGEISNSSAAKVADALGASLEKRVKDIKTKATELAKVLPKESKSGGKLPSFAEVKAALPKGQEPGEALKSDWMLWHAVGHAIDAKQLPAIAEPVLRERIALAACAGAGPVAEATLALHVLENLKAYVAWEMLLPGSRAPAKSNEVGCPFQANLAKEVAARRVLMQAGFPVEVAAACAAKGASSVDATIKEMAAEESKSAVLPMYAAPPAPKEPKQKAEGGKKGKGDDAPAQGGSAAPAAKAPAAGFIPKLHNATATQELQWQLLAYQLRPRTTLGAAAAGPAPAPVAAGAAGGQPAKKQAQGQGQGKTRAASGGAAAAKAPGGFAGTWAPTGAAGMPPGHTPYSWSHEKPKNEEASFPRTWEPAGAELPPGHTLYSWEKVLGASGGGGGRGGAQAASSSTAGGKAGKEGKATPAAAPAQAKAAPAGGGGGGAAPAEGSPEAALAKLDIRCGRITECGRVPDSDALYLLKVDVGEDKPRQVVSSLVKHYKAEELTNRQVMVYCNIKPGKMRGFESQAMVLAAVKDKGADHEKCELLAPPKGAKEGTRPMCGSLGVGSLSEGVSTKNISKVWAQVQPSLLTNGSREATFSGTILKLPEGVITAPTLTDVSIS